MSTPASQQSGQNQQDADARPNYKKTLNLPRTGFPMRANLVQNEPQSLKRWARLGLYQRLRAERDGAERYVFHDGPPYANGDIHMGHLLNKCLKDFVVRTRSMAGKDCPFIPGWDCHGLPIEHKVLTEALGSGKAEKLASLDENARRSAIRNECRRYAERYVKIQSQQMQRLLTLADYDNPYLTMNPDYEAEALEVFAELLEQGLVRRRRKPVHWSIDNQTALAEAELEYHQREDPSVFVEFDAAERSAVERAFGLEEDALDRTPTLMIWTTTPWTLPANLLIAAHPRHTYSLVEIDGSITIVAAEALERISQTSGSSNVRTIATAPGERLLGLRYRHPFVDESALSEHLGAETRDDAPLYRVVAAEHVTLEEGTGLVHTAPGHGHEDYALGLAEGAPIYCPVQENGTFNDSAPEWLRGVTVWDANERICEHLNETGRMFHQTSIAHSYPHDWRSKSPVIFRATEQWFVEVDRPIESDGRTLRRRALDATDEIQFLPHWGRQRMRGMVESRPDWCLSRQRAWGLPIPAFRDADGIILLTAASVRAVASVMREKGSDCWLSDDPATLLSQYEKEHDPEAPEDLDFASLHKMHDIFDVWFESGSSWRAVLRQRTEGFPADLYLEGSDQHRGWFQVSLLTALGAQGQAPYRALLTHGFMVDRDGRKMSKSLGNTLDVQDLLERFGADVARWWAGTLAYESDVKVDIAFFEEAGEAYRKVRNTLRFMLGNLGDFTPEVREQSDQPVDPESFPPTSLDAWALAQFDRLNATVQQAYERCDFRQATTALYDFCNDALSSVYLAAVKDRLYCDAPDSERRRRTQRALWALTDGLCRLLAPIIPHTADEAWRALWRSDDDATCVHLQTYLPPLNVEADEDWPRVMESRDAALAALERVRQSGGVENPLDAGLVLPDPKNRLARFDTADLCDLMGVSRITLDPSASEVSVLDLRAEPRCDRSWKRDGTVRQRSDGGMLSDRDAQAVGVE